MNLVDTLPKDGDEQIIFSPAGKINDTEVAGTVNPEWFGNSFPDLANAETPLTEEQFSQLCAIDWTWKANAERWRSENLI